ncbi:putative RNase H-like nuclease [Halarchaeum rubridurum]|uniref:Putative RNase H-like nuclease n=1 Tax=Halarchaeum rubridurum TaxID=489911 RepID=A0A830FYP5_9EURY|nr:DUF429 domain-containing protein [Halarchaeum rubridurum]MBP1954393.1 putative RNase H-like nuclease [Halarchaeum rubridurum]GGM60627.1 hypothetical protein GCM10009017_08500 [Halarchaeum rubridurum]
MPASATAVGVDWGVNGWVAAVRDGAGWDTRLHPSLLSVWHAHRDADAVLVDVPVGLPERGRRACDERAREVLGSQRRRVFLAPPRAALDAPTYAAAKRRVEARTDGSLTTQTWNVLPQVRDADVLLAEHPDARGVVREAHPEVCFAGLGDGPIAPAKTDDAGVEARLDVLDRYDDARAAYERLVAERIDDPPAHGRRFRADNRDDLLDAMCLALTGWTDRGTLRTLPDDPPRDPERRVPMEIVYRDVP